MFCHNFFCKVQLSNVSILVVYHLCLLLICKPDALYMILDVNFPVYSSRCYNGSFIFICYLQSDENNISAEYSAQMSRLKMKDGFSKVLFSSLVKKVWKYHRTAYVIQIGENWKVTDADALQI